MSHGQSYRRLTAARLAKDIPSLLGHIEEGRLTLCALVEVKDVITPGNVEDVVAAIFGSSRVQIEKWVAARAPRPDVPTTLRQLPTIAVSALAPATPAPVTGAQATVPLPAAHRPRVEALSATRFKLQMTISEELCEKIERAKDLMRHRNPSGDLVVLIEAAIDALVRELEHSRLAKWKSPRKDAAPKVASAAAEPAGERAVPRPTRREVFERDGEQCTYVGAHGERCPARGYLELDHIHSRGRGGTNEVTNLRILCRAHNKLHAEEDFGREHIEDRIRFRQRKSMRPQGGEEVET